MHHQCDMVCGIVCQLSIYKYTFQCYNHVLYSWCCQVETDGLYNHEEDESFREADDADDDTGLNTRGLVSEHNKKKKKSGGFQSMGKN